MNTKKELTTDDVHHIANLANIPLSASDTKDLSGKLSETLVEVDKLGEIDTTGTTPTAHVTGSENVTRSDKKDSTQGITKDTALRNSSSTYKDLFQVKAIFEEKSQNE